VSVSAGCTILIGHTEDPTLDFIQVVDEPDRRFVVMLSTIRRNRVMPASMSGE
jgi:hypothetical protein